MHTRVKLTVDDDWFACRVAQHTDFIFAFKNNVEVALNLLQEQLNLIKLGDLFASLIINKWSYLEYSASKHCQDGYQYQ